MTVTRVLGLGVGVLGTSLALGVVTVTVALLLFDMLPVDVPWKIFRNTWTKRLGCKKHTSASGISCTTRYGTGCGRD